MHTYNIRPLYISYKVINIVQFNKLSSVYSNSVLKCIILSKRIIHIFLVLYFQLNV